MNEKKPSITRELEARLSGCLFESCEFGTRNGTCSPEETQKLLSRCDDQGMALANNIPDFKMLSVGYRYNLGHCTLRFEDYQALGRPSKIKVMQQIESGD